MLNNKHIHIRIALISALLFISKFAVLNHSVEHPFHTQDQSCQIFLQYEESGSEPTSIALQLPDQYKSIIHTNQLVSFKLALSQSKYYARAPPFLS